MHRLSSHPAIGDISKAVNRPDIFWDGYFADASQYRWLSGWAAREYFRSRDKNMYRRWDVGWPELDEFLDSRVDRWRVLDMLGAITQWRTINGYQLQAVTGIDLTHRRGDILRALWGAGLIEVGLSLAGLRVSHDLREAMFRPGHSLEWKRFRKRVSYPEWLNVCAGFDGLGGAPFERHNTLAVEACLRVAEFHPFPGLLGEMESSMDAYFGSGAGRTMSLLDGVDTRRADGTLVRFDGLRVALELTSGAFPKLQAKVQRWARYLINSPLEEAPVVVVFLLAPRPDRSKGAWEAKKARRLISKEVATYGRRLDGRLLVAKWTDWFPASHEAGDDFRTLRCFSRDPEGEEGFAQPIDLADPYAITPVWDREKALSVVDVKSDCGMTPHWLRTKTPTPMWAHSLVELGALTPPVQPARTPASKYQPNGRESLNPFTLPPNVAPRMG